MKTKTKTKEDSTQKADRSLKGVVVSNKMNKTVIVSVSRFIKHPLYGKFYKVNKKYKAHDEDNTYQIGDTVRIVSTRPISKDKKFKVVSKE